jgi:CHAT domain-containing protein/tetratricopeptide (TPR) repeat protein
MKTFRSIFPVLAFILAALFVAAAAPAGAAEPSKKLQQLQDEVAGLIQAGSYQQALPLAKQSLALAVEEFGPGSPQASTQSFGAGMVAEAVGDFAEAARQYAECVRIREILSGRDSPIVAGALERLAHALLKQGRLTEAEAQYSRAIQIQHDLYGEDHVAGGAYSGLGAVNLARGDYGGALANYRKAVHQLTSRPLERVTDRSIMETQIKEHRDAFIGLGRAAAALRRQPGASERGLMEESFAAGQRAWATSAASALAKMTVRLKAGETELGRSVRHLDELNERIANLFQQDMDGAAAMTQTQQFRQWMNTFTATDAAQMKDMAPLMKRQREAAGVVKRIEELARRQRDLMKRCPTPGGPGCAGSDREHVALSREMNELSAKASQGVGEQDLRGAKETARLAMQSLAGFQKLPGFMEAATTMKAHRDESQRLEAELNTARADVVKRFPEYLSLSDPAPLTVAETQKLLKEDEALVAILTGPESSLVWAVTAHGSDWAEIEAGDAALAAEVKALRAGLEPTADGTPASFDIARAHSLYKLLLGRLAPTLAGKQHVILVATGPLSSLPFQVLVTEPPRPGLSQAEALKDAQWLIRKHALSVLPSVQSLSALRKLAAAGIAVKPYFGMGNPELGGPAPVPGEARGKAKAKVSLAALYRGGGAADLPLLQTLSPLPETAGELRRVARTLGASEDSIVVGQAATKARLFATPLQDYRVLHFATHGLVAGDLSGLQEPALVLTLPPQPAKAEDALLTASEVATLRLNADWTVLSACNTASGDKLGADALSGLARAFFFAGTRALLVSHWAVDSESAVNLTTRTFGFLAQAPQMRRAEAFQQAMLTLIAEGQPPSRWAPFVIVGEGGPVVRQRG